ncbi:N,N'-diacetylchitobiose transport system substrate-binding protein [Candidatus Hakubella thermalkaliphila]|uniref:N,N'-diacetylchitobiose transport system substrate-binding protein n=1 Tax=Candidatus Hakubella thermalkaliphila TaxID=2754717 RepID=A0A6V8PJN8_9ACTN|nr:Multiple sugar-binding protein [Bacillota bacterium]GFP32350.1 N,N'-diacetylchitobiose transport system substrate-binding protein [Candidatus Hakubella thermalkaliphila]
MEKAKRIFVVVAVALLAALLLSCRPAPLVEEAEEAKEARIVYMTNPWGVPSKELLDEFKKETGIEVEVTVIKDDRALKDKVITATVGRVAPADAIYVGISNLGILSRGGSLVPLNQMVRKDLLDGVEGSELFKVEGQLYAVPVYQQMVMLCYDAAALQEIGASVPTTWQELTEVARELKERGVKKYPITFGARSWSWYLMALSMGDPLFDKELNPTFNKPGSGGLRAMELLANFFKEELISPDRVADVNPHPAFWAGEAVFHQAWQGALAVSNDPAKSKVAPNARYMLLPDKHYTWNLPAGIGISAFTDKREEVLKFIEWFTTDKVQLSLYDDFGMFPASKSSFARLGEEGKIEGYELMTEQAKYVWAIPYDALWFPEFDVEVTETVKRVVRGEITPQAGIDYLAEYVLRLKKEYGD